jgi:FkbM family methyltransferase
VPSDPTTPPDVVEARNAFGVYCIPRESAWRPAAQKVIAGSVWEKQTVDFVRARCGDGDVVHAGAFFGDSLPAVSAALAPGARIWAFEPNPRSFACAAETIRRNGLDNVTLTHAALTRTPGTLHLRVVSAEGVALGGASRLAPRAADGVVAVDGVRIDDRVPEGRRVSIVQLDLEGHEKEALLGARAVIAASRPLLVLETFEDLDWLRATFPDAGYTRETKVNANTVFAPTART